MNQNAEEIREPLQDKNMESRRKEIRVRMFDEVDDFEHEKSEEQKKQEEGGDLEEKKTAPKQDPRQPSEHDIIVPQLVQTLHQGKGGQEEDCRRVTEEERQGPIIPFGRQVHGRRKLKRKRWRFRLPQKERREVCSARWFRGSGRETGYAEG